MKDHLPDYHHHIQARNRHRRMHDLHANHVPKEPRCVSRREKVIAGFILGSLAYFVASCFTDHRLSAPKIDRREFNFIHKPNQPY
jgi:hypothetical protein